jgi:hypothetical protein
MLVYMTAYTDFPMFADNLATACQDLKGKDLPDLVTGASSGQKITDADCNAVALMINATGLFEYPAQCNFPVMFDKFTAESYCSTSQMKSQSSRKLIFEELFETEPKNWVVSADPVDKTTWLPRNWTYGVVPFRNSSGCIH